MGTIALPDRILDIEVPPELIADHPVEAEGRRRDDVRMLVAERSTGRLTHARAADLDRFLARRRRARGQHLADAGRGRARRRRLGGRPPVDAARRAPLGGRGPDAVRPRQPAAPGRPRAGHPARRAAGCVRLRRAASPAGACGRPTSSPPRRSPAFLAEHGRPIRYGCTDTAWPIADYQTVFARHLPDDIGLGSAEMPSAGRPFTRELVRRLVDRGRRVRAHHAAHRRVVPRVARAALRRALPSARVDRPASSTRHAPRAAGSSPSAPRRPGRIETDAVDGRAHAGDGWTELVITPERGLEVVDGIISGWHEPEASHLLLMEAVAGRAAPRGQLRRRPAPSATTGTSSATSTWCVP